MGRKAINTSKTNIKLPVWNKTQVSTHDKITAAMEATYLDLRKQHRRTRDVKAQLKALYFVRQLTTTRHDYYAKLDSPTRVFHRLWVAAYFDSQVVKDAMNEVEA